MFKVNNNYVLFNKYFRGSISDENINIFLRFIDEISGFLDRQTKTVDWSQIIKMYPEITATINKDILELLFFNYYFDFDYDSRKIFVYGQVEREEDIGLIMLSIVKIASMLKKEKLSQEFENGGNYGK